MIIYIYIFDIYNTFFLKYILKKKKKKYCIHQNTLLIFINTLFYCKLVVLCVNK